MERILVLTQLQLHCVAWDKLIHFYPGLCIQLICLKNESKRDTEDCEPSPEWQLLRPLWNHCILPANDVVSYSSSWASLVPQVVMNLPAIQETQVRSLGQEDPLEKEMAAHSSILAWETPWTEEPGGLQSMGSQRVRQDCETNPCIPRSSLLHPDPTSESLLPQSTQPPLRARWSWESIFFFGAG